MGRLLPLYKTYISNLMKYNAGFFQKLKYSRQILYFCQKLQQISFGLLKKIVKTIRLNFLSLGFVLNFKVLAYG